MAYETLYRRFRPQRFCDVVGQEHITSTLRNQIKSGRTAHAYLFCGTRGTGKTTTARIFARALNCLSPEDGEPCGRCASCQAGEGLDIIEIDGASNSRVEEARDLLEKVRFAPIAGKKKVYIIDEVHMLSNSAFNALLKTLEEPPDYVVFILATTEPHKLLPTILSRCQRYDFHRVSEAGLIDLLRRVLTESGASFDEEGLQAIAQAADGSARDALSLAEQCLAFCENNAVGERVRAVLGSMSPDFLFALADAILAGNSAGCMQAVDDVLRAGRDPGVFVRDLTAHFRSLMLISACGDARSLIECTPERYRQLEAQAKNCLLERALRAIDLLSGTENAMRALARPRVLLEATLLRIARPQDELTLESLLDRVGSLERRLEALSSLPRASAPPAAAPQPEPPASDDGRPPWEDPAGAPVTAAAETAPPSAQASAPPAPAPQASGADTKEVYAAVTAAMKPGVRTMTSRWKHSFENGTLTFYVPAVHQKTMLPVLNAQCALLAEAAEPAAGKITVAFVPEGASSAASAAPAPPVQKKQTLREKGEELFGPFTEILD